MRQTFKTVFLLSRPMRLLFYAINGVGLGHIRRLVLIAEEVRRQSPDAHILFITNSAYPQIVEEKGFPCIRLPSPFSPTVKSHFSLKTIPAELHDMLFLSALRTFSPDAMVFDGVWSEELLKACKANRIKTVMILRKSTNEHMAQMLERWKAFDLVCVTHTGKELELLGTTKDLLAGLKKMDVVLAGPVMPLVESPEAAKDQGEDKEEFRLLVTAGGGGWPTTQGFLDAVCNALKQLLSEHGDISADVVTGPLFSGTVPELPRTQVHRYLENADMLRTMGEVSLAIAQAGYNTCNDLVASQLPAILVPAPREIESQEERAKYFEEKGCAQVVDQEDSAIRAAIEQLYADRSLLLKMRNACSKAVSSSGTPVIAEHILRLAPTIIHIDINSRQSQADPAEFIVAQGSPSDAAYERLSALREKSQFVLLKAGMEWFGTKLDAAAFIGRVDAVQIPLSAAYYAKLASGALGDVPDDFRAALVNLTASYMFFEVRVDVTADMLKSLLAVTEAIASLGCPQVHLSLAEDISDDMIAEPLAELRKSGLADEGVRIYCSSLKIVPSEFSRERTLYHIYHRRTRLNSELLALEGSKDVKIWMEKFHPKITPERPLKMIDHRIRLLKMRYPHLTLSMARDVKSSDTEEELWRDWFAAQKILKMLEQKISRTQRAMLGDVTKEIDEILLEQVRLKGGEGSGEHTWRSLDRRKNKLTLHYNNLWNTHIKPLDDEYQRLSAEERRLAKPLYALLVARRKKEYTALRQKPAVRRYSSLVREIQHLDKRVERLSREIEQGQAEKTI